jgi:Xaa-Pro aminopeptidase
MIPASHYRDRRRQLLDRLDGPLLLFAGGERPRSYPGDPIPYRADSQFHFLFPNPEPGSAAFFDPEEGTVTLFLPERTQVDEIWTGPRPPFDRMREAVDVDAVEAVEHLEEWLEDRVNGRSVGSVAVADPVANARARRITGLPLDFADSNDIAPAPLQHVLADLRFHKAEAELDEMRRVAEITGAGFLEAMGATAAGRTEQEITGILEGAYIRAGATCAFNSIVSVRGEVLHNHSHAHTLRDGDLLLVDSGAELPSGYVADVTRTFPVNGHFTPEQRDVYGIVLAALKEATDRVRVGVRYGDIHRAASRVIARGLVDLKLLRGEPDGLVERGAHALFFPHGVGHLLGLEAHDLEPFGDRILYGPARVRSTQFGTSFLRIDLDLAERMVVTIEPGLYFVPGILRLPEFHEKFHDCVDFERAEQWLAMNDGRGFGGVRLEDDVVVTAAEPEILTLRIPREVDDVEAAVGVRAAMGARTG